MNLNTLSATEIVDRIRAGLNSAEEIMHDCLDRIRERNPEIDAFVALDEELAIRRARAADRAKSPGSLHGVPFAIKDIIDTRDFVTTWGSPIYGSVRPPRNASCVELFMRAGAIPVGKSLTTEFACFTPGKTVNPHNPAHTPGGSSSGSADAVADCMVPLGFGSQTAASLIRPAAFCGIFAYKSSHGQIDDEGVMGLSPSLDSLGILARSVADLKRCRSVLCQRHEAPIWPDDSTPRIALMRGPHWSECSESGRDACISAMSILADCGAKTTELSHPIPFEGLSDAHKIVMEYEMSTTRCFEYFNHRESLSPKFAEMMESGLAIEVERYEKALDMRDRAQRRADAFFSEVDVLLTPAAQGEAPHGLHTTGDPLFSRMWTLLQLPAVAIPHGAGEHGLPLAIQMVARKGEDDRLLAAAEWVARKLGH